MLQVCITIIVCRETQLNIYQNRRKGSKILLFVLHNFFFHVWPLSFKGKNLRRMINYLIMLYYMYTISTVDIKMFRKEDHSFSMIQMLNGTLLKKILLSTQVLSVVKAQNCSWRHLHTVHGLINKELRGFSQLHFKTHRHSLKLFKTKTY